MLAVPAKETHHRLLRKEYVGLVPLSLNYYAPTLMCTSCGQMPHEVRVLEPYGVALKLCAKCGTLTPCDEELCLLTPTISATTAA